MANGTNIAASKNRGCGAFHLYMDEFCGGNITVSVQWDHKKAGSEEDSSSPVNSSWNAKIPVPDVPPFLLPLADPFRYLLLAL
ncbi:hypothetical protein Tco_1527781 [Tanacetum coccineum]